jgi:hypothetical protein
LAEKFFPLTKISLPCFQAVASKQGRQKAVVIWRKLLARLIRLFSFPPRWWVLLRLLFSSQQWLYFVYIITKERELFWFL